MSNDSYDTELITESAQKLFSREFGLEFIRRYQETGEAEKKSLIRQCLEMGWQGLIIDETAGGVGFGLEALCALLEELGKAAFPTLYFSHFVAPPLLLNKLGSTELRTSLLAAMAVGEQLPVVAADSSSMESFCGENGIRASKTNEGFELSGQVDFLCDLDSATVLLVPALTAEGSMVLHAIAPDLEGVEIAPRPDKSYGSTFTLDLNKVQVDSGCLLELNSRIPLQQTYRLCAVAKSAEMIGGAERAMKIALEYVMVRKQFGKLLAEFQAVQHQAADMYKVVDIARLFVKDALEQLDGGDEPDLLAHYCKSWANDACFEACSTSHQLMGGTGYMTETDLQLLSAQVLRNQYEFGSSDYHREIVGKSLGL